MKYNNFTNQAKQLLVAAKHNAKARVYLDGGKSEVLMQDLIDAVNQSGVWRQHFSEVGFAPSNVLARLGTHYNEELVEAHHVEWGTLGKELSRALSGNPNYLGVNDILVAMLSILVQVPSQRENASCGSQIHWTKLCQQIDEVADRYPWELPEYMLRQLPTYAQRETVHMQFLTDTELMVTYLVYGLGPWRKHSFSEIAQTLNLSTEAIHSILDGAEARVARSFLASVQTRTLAQA